MLNYQSILEETIASVRAERGFIVLCHPSTYTPTEFIALFNFDSTATQQPIGEQTNEYQYIWESLPRLFAEKQPLLTSNVVNESYYRRRFLFWSPRSVILVPLRKEAVTYGLLWCDKRIVTKGVWEPQDLAQAVSLMERSAAL